MAFLCKYIEKLESSGSFRVEWSCGAAKTQLHLRCTNLWSNSASSAPQIEESVPFGTAPALGKLELRAGAVPNGASNREYVMSTTHENSMIKRIEYVDTAKIKEIGTIKILPRAQQYWRRWNSFIFSIVFS